MPRVRVHAFVIAAIESESDILSYMGLVDADGNGLKGIRMTGQVVAKIGQSWQVFLQATMKEHLFSIAKNNLTLMPKGLIVTPYYCAVDGEIQTIDGLLVPFLSPRPDGYHLTRAEVIAEIHKTNGENVSTATEDVSAMTPATGDVETPTTTMTVANNTTAPQTAVNTQKTTTPVTVVTPKVVTPTTTTTTVAPTAVTPTAVITTATFGADPTTTAGVYAYKLLTLIHSHLFFTHINSRLQYG